VFLMDSLVARKMPNAAHCTSAHCTLPALACTPLTIAIHYFLITQQSQTLDLCLDMMRASASRSVACTIFHSLPSGSAAFQVNALKRNIMTRDIHSSFTPLQLGINQNGKRSDMNSLKTDSSISSTSNESFSSASASSDISSARGRNAVSLLPVYLTDARSVTKYNAQSSPNGALQLSVAENQMLEDLLVPALRKFSSECNDDTTVEGLFRSDQIYYQPTHGREKTRLAVASYLETILKIPSQKKLDVDGIVLGAGCNAVLENLCFTLTEPGDAVLLPTPYYAAFEFDLVARAALNIVPVNTMDFHPECNQEDGQSIVREKYFPNRASLDAAYEKALASGSQPKILLLSHPNNPLGICYPPSVIKECIEWARENKIHLVSDEIYAGSVYEKVNADGEEVFQSALHLASFDAQSSTAKGLGLGPYIHFVYALSKDFALSGLRVGVAYSENEEIRLPMQKLNDLCQVSSQTQLTVENLLTSSCERGTNWATDEFLPENHRRIQERSLRLQKCLDECSIPYLKGDSGLFLWMDFSEFLIGEPKIGQCVVESDESKDVRERSLYLELMHEFGLLFTPGRSMRAEYPGFFRCVFTAASDEEFSLGLDRIKKYVDTKRSF
jgi:aspartate/methionine/tyrosine aminotransferase